MKPSGSASAGSASWWCWSPWWSAWRAGSARCSAAVDALAWRSGAGAELAWACSPAPASSRARLSVAATELGWTLAVEDMEWSSGGEGCCAERKNNKKNSLISLSRSTKVRLFAPTTRLFAPYQKRRAPVEFRALSMGVLSSFVLFARNTMADPIFVAAREKFIRTRYPTPDGLPIFGVDAPDRTPEQLEEIHVHITREERIKEEVCWFCLYRESLCICPVRMCGCQCDGCKTKMYTASRCYRCQCRQCRAVGRSYTIGHNSLGV